MARVCAHEYTQLGWHSIARAGIEREQRRRGGERTGAIMMPVTDEKGVKCGCKLGFSQERWMAQVKVWDSFFDQILRHERNWTGVDKRHWTEREVPGAEDQS